MIMFVVTKEVDTYICLGKEVEIVIYIGKWKGRAARKKEKFINRRRGKY